jgi:hypothetical protein
MYACVIGHILSFFTKEEAAVRFSYIVSASTIAKQILMIFAEYSKLNKVTVSWY